VKEEHGKEKEGKGEFCACSKCKHHKKAAVGQCGGAYFLGFLGAVIYFLQTTDGFWPGVLAFLKALVWPVFVVHHLLGL
jgi:hypothetical protein